MPAGTLVYDADCGFCTRTAGWLRRRSCRIQPWQSLDLGQLGLTEADVTTAAYWLDADGRVAERGAGAIARALQARGGPAALLGGLIASRPTRPLADLVYRWVARHRGTLPGGETCAIGDGQPNSKPKAPWWAPGLYVAFFVAWVVGYSMTAHQNEPFPALIQPRFQSAPQQVARLDVDYVAVLDDGTRVPVNSGDLFPPSGGKRLSISNYLLTEERTDDPRTRAWLAARVEDLDLPGEAADLTISKAWLVVAPDSGATVSREVLYEWTVPLGDVS